MFSSDLGHEMFGFNGKTLTFGDLASKWIYNTFSVDVILHQFFVTVLVTVLFF